MNLLNDFRVQKICNYKNEKYSVRDNGAIYRHSRSDKSKRLLDNKWTFGRVGRGGYLYIAGVQAHRIVATAFHGESPKSDMVVDHKDTNKQNNRSENLRWVTKEENILNNPNTIHKIEYITGRPINEVLKNPKILREANKNKQNTSWMRPVSKEEAKNLQKWQEYWLNDDKKYSNSAMGEWVFSPHNHKKNEVVEKMLEDIRNAVKPASLRSKKMKEQTVISDSLQSGEMETSEDKYFYDSLNENAKQNWKTPTEFLCCPRLDEEQSLKQYLKNLKIDEVFSRNIYGFNKLLNFFYDSEKDLIITEIYADSAVIEQYKLMRITYEYQTFFHDTIGSYHTKEGGDKYFTLKIGKEWTGGDVFDDFC